MENIFSTLIIEEKPEYVEELELKYNLKLPPVFKAFVQTFEFGKFKPKAKHKIMYSDENIGYDSFNTSLEKSMKVYCSQGEFYTKPKLLPIIISGMYHNGICLSMNEKEPDKIYLMEDYDDFTLVANNILEFVRNLKQVHWDTLKLFKKSSLVAR